ncbi:MAG: hypothetical protein LBG80_15435 [Bacteroidales bacterium]|jgi:hypothetical protein|nr:hypothetical protein [Bacteroidales bacterium]
MKEKKIKKVRAIKKQVQEQAEGQWKRLKERNAFAGGFWKRFKTHVDERGDKLSTLAKSMGLSPFIFIGGIRNQSIIGIDIFQKILEVYPELNPEWLLTGRGMQFRSLSVSKNIQAATIIKESEKKRRDTNKNLQRMKQLLQQLEEIHTRTTAGI